MEKNKKHLIIAGIAIVVVIAVAVAIPMFKKSTPAVAEVPVAEVQAEKPAPVAATDGGKAAWEAMLKKFDGKTVTLAADCTATPITQSQKKGATVLLVNDSDVSHTVLVGTDSYTVGGKHYKTVALNTAGTTIISCDAKANVANIAVE